VPGLRGVVPRWTRIRYTGCDPTGARIEREVDGFHARVVQHECDISSASCIRCVSATSRSSGYTSVLFPGLDATPDDD
jgi:peptide deformylase